MIAIVAIRPIYHLDFMITTYLSPDAVLRRIPELLVTKVVWDSTPLILIIPATVFFREFFCDALLSPSVGLEIVLMAPLIPKVQAHFTKNGFITCTAG